MPVYTTDALILRTYKLAESDRIVVFLTRDRGKKRGVAKGARRARSGSAALEPLTCAGVGYFERERRDLVRLDYVEPQRSALTNVARGTQDASALATRNTSPSSSTSGRPRGTPTRRCTGSARR